MGSKRLGLARTQALLENLKRDLNMNGAAFVGASLKGTSTVTYGDGALSGSTTAPTTKVVTVNGEIITTITVDLTNLSASGAVGKIVGNEEAAADGTAPAYLMQWSTTTNGVMYKAEMSCVEVPAGNATLLDFDLETDDVALEQGADPSTNNVVILAAAGNFAQGTTIQDLSVGDIGNDQYIYIITGAAIGATGDAQFSAGKFVIKFYGYVDF